MGLDLASHDEKAAVLELGGDTFLGHGVLEVETSFRSEAQAGDGGVGDNGGFVVAMPRHSLRAIVVKIEEAGVEGGIEQFPGPVLQFAEKGGPWDGLLGGTGVSVAKTAITDPGDLA